MKAVGVEAVSVAVKDDGTYLVPRRLATRGDRKVQKIFGRLLMSENHSYESSEDGAKKLVLRMKSMVPVRTSQGEFFARHFSVNDLLTFASSYFAKGVEKSAVDMKAFGEAALKSLVCINETDKTAALTDATFAVLSDVDLKALTAAVAQASDLNIPESESCVEGLGSALYDHVADSAKRMAESSASIKRTLDGSFGTLSDSLKGALKSDLTGLASVREKLFASSAMEAMRRTTAPGERILGMLPTGVSTKASFPEDRVQPLRIELPLVPKFEESPAGRAVLAQEESVRQLREVVVLSGEMTEKIGNLTETVLTKVLPEWFRNLKEGAEITNTTLGQAKESLKWAKYAIFASIVITVLMTAWQLWIAREYKLDNDRQQATAESLLREQLSVMRDQNRQLIEDSRLLRESVANLQVAIATSKPFATSKKPAP